MLTLGVLATWARTSPVPPDEFTVVVVEQVISVGGRAYVPAFVVAQDAELVAEHELDRADAGGLKRQRVLRQRERLHFTRVLASHV